jgi:hypothetical protein
MQCGTNGVASNNVPWGNRRARRGRLELAHRGEGTVRWWFHSVAVMFVGDGFIYFIACLEKKHVLVAQIYTNMFFYKSIYNRGIKQDNIFKYST